LYFWIKGKQADAYGRGLVFLESVVEMVKHKVGWVLGVGKNAAEVGGDEMGAGDERAPCLKKHLNLMRDFTDSRERISAITSFGRLSEIVFLIPMPIEEPVSSITIYN
jgi:hypothetical protein